MMKGLHSFCRAPILLMVLAMILTVVVHCVNVAPETSVAPSAMFTDDEPAPTEVLARNAILGYCSTCHQAGRSGADFGRANLEIGEMRNNRELWQEVVRRVREGEMPPRKFPQLSPRSRNAIIEWIEGDVLSAPNAPNVLVRRLQRVEYANSIRDLLGVHVSAESLPDDESSFHSSANISPDHMQRYHAAALALVEAVFQSGGRPGGELELSSRILELCDGDCARPEDSTSARAFVAELAGRAFRRPVDGAELDELMAPFARALKQGKTSEEGMRTLLVDILTSPKFLLRSDASPRDAGDFPLAARLAFFLWRSGPDQELFALAKNGQLDASLKQQAARLLQSPRSEDFTRGLASSWLSLSKIDNAYQLDPLLRQDMRQETERSLDAVLREERSALDLIDADFTFLNERLARHYGIPGVHGSQMRRVHLGTSQRGGLLTQGSFLAMTSEGYETSPVNRGKWILESLLGAAPIRPPAGILQALEETTLKFEKGSPRKLMEAHRVNPSCAQCHARMDAFGMSLENFDGRGVWRNSGGEKHVDAVGDLPDGRQLYGVTGLKAHLFKEREKFVLALSEALLRNALGRKLNDEDRKDLAAIPALTAPKNHRFCDIVLAVIDTPAFRQYSPHAPREEVRHDFNME